MAAYLIALCRGVSDRRRLEDYWSNIGATFEGVGADLHVAYMPFEQLEGHLHVDGVVLFEFPSMEIARRWYRSSAYQALKKQRESAAEFDFILVEGGAKPTWERMPHTKITNP
jgi:uncharacterized protein (DUF1330 family)